MKKELNFQRKTQFFAETQCKKPPKLRFPRFSAKFLSTHLHTTVLYEIDLKSTGKSMSIKVIYQNVVKMFHSMSLCQILEILVADLGLELNKKSGTQ